VRNLRPRLAWPVPGISAFPEINVRTYVTYAGKPGIWFFSLDAASRLGVAAARRLYRLPYFRTHATISRDPSAADAVMYESERVDRDGVSEARFKGTYGPVGPAQLAAPGTLEHWLTERYCLYTVDGSGRVLRGEIHHPPWPLQAARAEIELNTMAAELGLTLPDQPLLHFARRQDVVFWPLGTANGSGTGTASDD
jgi:uncharacterized protein YqjF (DUF2071 family)